MSSTIKPFQLFEYDIDSKRGFVYYSFYWCVFLYASYAALPRIVDIFLCFWVALWALYLIFFLYRRFWYSYLSEKLYIIFAITVDFEDDKKLFNLYKKLILSFKEGLKDYDLRNDVIVKIRPVDVAFSDHSAAEAKTKLNLPCSTLIISGIPITSKHEIEFKLNFHYEFLYPGDKKNEKIYKSAFSKKIEKALVERSWVIKDTINSKKNLNASLVNVSTYILSLCMASLGRVDLAKKLMKPAIDECKQNAHKTNIYGPLIADINNYIFKINELKFNIKYWGLKIDELRPLALEMSKINKNSYATNMSLAIVRELEGNRVAAIEHTKKAEYNHPPKIMDYKFNYLYFAITDRAYTEVIKILNDIKLLTGIKSVLPIINFLEHQYKTSYNISLLFNMGVINYYFGDTESGIDDLQKFKKLAAGNDELTPLINEVNEILT